MVEQIDELAKGDFVSVGDTFGVVVFVEHEDHIPEAHLGIWYGEYNERGIPKYRTVPAEYCKKSEAFEVYH